MLVLVFASREEEAKKGCERGGVAQPQLLRLEETKSEEGEEASWRKQNQRKGKKLVCCRGEIEME